jgi:hypothetical protein
MARVVGEDIGSLQRQAEALATRAQALTDTYRRRTWWRFALVFFPVPFVVVLLRLELEAWHYYLAGAAYLGFSAWLYAADSAASARCDEAVKAAERAQQSLEEARQTPASAGSARTR